MPSFAAAQVSLALQNTFVALCACALCIHLSFRDPIVSLWNGWLLMLSYASIIIFAIFADVSSAARILIIERDWVVEICGEDNNRLAGDKTDVVFRTNTNIIYRLKIVHTVCFI